MKYLGQVSLDGTDRLLIDAEPHVMSRLRPLFNGILTSGARGKFTHKPISIAFNQSHSKDVLWINERYPLEIPMSIYTELKMKAHSYDKILAEVARADQNKDWTPSPQAYKLALPLREHQIQFHNMAIKVKRMLLADKMGLGKTASAISLLCEPAHRPAIVVVPPHLCTQWEEEVHRFLPDLKVHVIRGFKTYNLSADTDVVITSYNRLEPWQDKIFSIPFKTVILDEVHELRHSGTNKRINCKKLSEQAEMCFGLSGTPIYNRGSEMWSVMDVISPNCLGSESEFKSEWCDWDSVREPAILHAYLKNRGLMLRRVPEDVGLNFGKASKHPYTLDADLNKLKEVQEVAKMLAISVLSGNIGDSDMSAREFDMKLRQATGIAKARPVAEFVKMLCEEGEKVIVGVWHREVYDILMKELAQYKPVMYSGSESVKQKDEAKKSFIEGDSQVFLLSLRSGAGLDGLQRVCNTVVFAELDWSPHVMDQVLARVDRDGQIKHVQGFYLTIKDGSDPFIMGINNEKRAQHDGVIEGIEVPVEILEDHGGGATRERVREMAKKYLASIGEDIPEAVEEVGLLGELAGALRKLKITTSTEADMQLAIFENLPKLLSEDILIEREFNFSKRSRIDFLISRDDERIGIECKNVATKRADVYRQLRRYVEDGGITALILFAPWHGVNAFKVDGIPCIVIDMTLNSI